LGNGVGEATHLGPSTIVFITASEPGGAGVERASTGCGVITADNGDLLFVEFRGTFTVGPFPFITGSGTTEFVGGTGRFSTATGSGTYEFINDVIARTGQLTQVGTISKPGPRRSGQSGRRGSVE